MKITQFAQAGLLAAVLALVSCGGNNTKSGSDSTSKPGEATASTSDANTLLGAGSTFVYPLFSKLFAEYDKETGIKVNYQSIGSGGGILQLTNKTIDFGDSDAPLNDDQAKKMGADVLHIPMCAGAVVISYNLPDLKSTLKLDPDVLANIFLGKITKWTDAKLKILNPDVKFPSQNIVVIHRSDGSGTTFIFSDYLTKVSKDWEAKVGRGKSLNWPVGLGGKGNEGVSGLIKQTPGSLGYTELLYALSNNMPVASVLNSAGNYIVPSIKSVSESANIDLPADTRISITNSPAANGYPISSFTWLLLYQDLSVLTINQTQAESLMNLVWWMTHDGQKLVEPLNYAPLPAEAVKKVEVLMKTITYNGKPVLK